MMSVKQKFTILFGAVCMTISAYSWAGNGYDLLPQYIISEKSGNVFTIVENQKATDI